MKSDAQLDALFNELNASVVSQSCRSARQLDDSERQLIDQLRLNDKKFDSDSLAEALYDNDSEWPDELAFTKGDKLIVKERRMDGWWLCEDRFGQHGIVPANRLRLLPPIAATVPTSSVPNRRTSLENINMRLPTRPLMTGSMFDSMFDDEPDLMSPFSRGFGHMNTYYSPMHRSMHFTNDDRFDQAPRVPPPPFTHQSSNELNHEAVRNIPIRIMRQDSAPILNQPVSNVYRPSQMSSRRPPQPPVRKFYATSSTEPPTSAGLAAASQAESLMNKLRQSIDKLSVGDVRWKSTEKPTRIITTTQNGSFDGTASQYHPPPPTHVWKGHTTLVSSAKPHTSTLNTTQNNSTVLNTPPSSNSTLNGMNSSPDEVQSPRESTLSESSEHQTTTDTIKQQQTNTSALMNALEELYDIPSKTESSNIRLDNSACQHLKEPSSERDVTPTRNSIGRQSLENSQSMFGNARRSDSTRLAQSGMTTSSSSAPTSLYLQSRQASLDALTPPNRFMPTTSTIAARHIQQSEPIGDRATNTLQREKKVTFSSTAQQASTSEQADAKMKTGGATTKSIIKKSAPSKIDSAFVRQVQTICDRIDQICRYLTGLTMNSRWRQPQVMQAYLYDIQMNTGELCHKLQQLINAIAGSSKSSESAAKIYPLKNSLSMLHDLRHMLNRTGWTLAALSRHGASDHLDALDQFIAVSKQVRDDCQSTMQYVRDHQADFESNAPSFNKRDADRSNSPVQDRPTSGRVIEEHELMSDAESLFDDYDFIDDIRPHKSAKKIDKQSDTVEEKENISSVDTQDLAILNMHLRQLDTHMQLLTTAIDEFLTCVEQTPDVFVSKGKLLILAAHKFVYIGDTVAQCVHNQDVAAAMRRMSDEMVSALKECVASTKSAAEQYPSISALQSMCDSVLRVSNTAHQLKTEMSQFV